MKSIKINLNKSIDDPLYGKSKWWGRADLPEGMAYPMEHYDDGEDDPLTLVCQIRCADLTPYDTKNQLPHEGMLYFFADIDEYVEAMGEVGESEFQNSLGEWEPEAYRVLYSPTEQGLNTHTITDPDGEPANLPAESLSFEVADDHYDSFKLLGKPYYEEIQELYPDHLCLLQIDENDEWGLRLYDCGMICFLIRPEDLKALDFSKVKVYFHSF